MSSVLTPNMEDYLETIITLEDKKKVVRAKDIAKALKVKMPSVTSAIEKLVRKKLVNHERYGYIELTTKGQEIASEIRRRHEILFSFLFETLNIDLETAEEDACKMEHLISPITIEKFVQFVQFVEACPEEHGLKCFNYYLKHGIRPEKCLLNKKKNK